MFRNTLILAFLLLIIIVPIKAQIISSIEINEENFPISEVIKYYEGNRIFNGVIDIPVLPQPMEKTKVEIKLTVADDIEQHKLGFLEQDWNLKLYHLDNATKIIGDSLYYWPGPHKVSDEYFISFEFVPLMSGKYSICINFDRPDNRLSPGAFFRGVSFEYCFNEIGELLLLDGAAKRPRDSYITPRVNFIKGDTIILKQYPQRKNSFAFEYEVIITPIPKIGEVSNITYRFTANENLPYGSNLDISTTGFNVLSQPRKLDKAINKDDYFEYSFDIKPEPINGENLIVMHFEYASESASSGISSQTIPIGFIFENDSTLKFISNDQNRLNLQDYPDKFRSIDNYRDKNRIKLNTYDINDFRKK